jgi:hypothetical protein
LNLGGIALLLLLYPIRPALQEPAMFNLAAALAKIETDPALERYFADEYENARELGADDEGAIALAARLTSAWDADGRRG